MLIWRRELDVNGRRSGRLARIVWDWVESPDDFISVR